MNNEIIITRNLTKSGESIILLIPKDIVDALDLKPNTLVEARIRKLE
jgi:antitoxin component of MazEF toxin-antitoxin module